MASLDATSNKKRSRTATLVVVCLALAVAARISIPYFRSSLRLGYMDSVIFTLRRLFSKEKDFARAHPDRGYTCSISELDSNEMLREICQKWTEKRLRV